MKKKFFNSYEHDASRAVGVALEVLHPRTVEDVKKIVLKNKRISIRGAGSGLEGGAVPQGDVVLDSSKLDEISNLDENRKTIEVEAGVVFDDLQDYLQDYNLELPVVPSSHSIASIGGMISTNAGGSRSLKYGRMSSWIKWIEVIDAHGRIERKGATELSDYVGMEGITGVIVRACLRLLPIIPRSASLIQSESAEELVNIIQELKQKQDVSSLEFFDKLISKTLGLQESFHLIVEIEGEENADHVKIMKLVDDAYSFSFKEKYIIEDVKIMINKFPKLMQWAEERDIPIFGHAGTGVVHPCFRAKQENMIPEMIKLVRSIGGQISGEYGIGLLKKEFVDMTDQKIWRNMKKRMDASGKFNFGKVIDIAR